MAIFDDMLEIREETGRVTAYAADMIHDMNRFLADVDQKSPKLYVWMIRDTGTDLAPVENGLTDWAEALINRSRWDTDKKAYQRFYVALLHPNRNENPVHGHLTGDFIEVTREGAETLLEQPRLSFHKGHEGYKNLGYRYRGVTMENNVPVLEYAKRGSSTCYIQLPGTVPVKFEDE